MSNKALILTLAVALVIGGVLGFLIKGWVSPPPVITTEQAPPLIIFKKIPVKIFVTKYIPRPGNLAGNSRSAPADTVFKLPEFEITDSISGIKTDTSGSSVEYDIKHTIKADPNKPDSLVSNWEPSFLFKLKEQIRTEKITITDTKYIPTPFFADGWFYTSLVAVGLLVLAIIF